MAFMWMKSSAYGRFAVGSIAWLSLFGEGLHFKFDSCGVGNVVQVRVVSLANDTNDS